MTFDVRSVDLAKLNSATKYPSIPTYHGLDPRNGDLTEEAVSFADETCVVGTEKIDGTNARIVLLPDGTYVIGSREELLHAQGDLIANPSQGIAAALKDAAEMMTRTLDLITVHYLEVYGGKVTAASKNYTGHRRVGHRLFDVAVIDPAVLDEPREEISRWREGEGQEFITTRQLNDCARIGMPVVPHLFSLDPRQLPTGLGETREWLAAHLPTTNVALDTQAVGRPEGIVLRSPDRRVIAKARFADYDRTLRRRGGK